MSQVTNRSRMLSDTLIYSGANYVSQVIGVFNSILLRKFLGPASMGVWGLLQVILDYCGQASLGTTRAMARDYPYYKGKGDYERANRIKNTTLSFTMMMSWVPFLFILVYLIFFGPQLDPVFRVCLYFLLGFLFLQRFYDFVVMLLRSDQKFKALSWVILFNSILSLAASLFAVRLWGLWGLLGSTTVIMCGLLLLMFRQEKITFQIQIDKTELLNELKVGIPLAASTFLVSVLRGLDKIIIADKLGFYELGIFSIASMVANYILSVPMLFAHVWYPNLQAAFGRKDGDLGAVKHYLEKPLIGMSILIPFLCALSFLVVPVIIKFLLKDFSAGVPVLRLYLLGVFFTVLGQYSINFLTTAGKFWSVIPVICASILINYGVSSWLVSQGWGLEGVAFGSVLALAVYGVGCMMLALKEILQPRQRSILLLRCVVLHLIIYFFVLMVESYNPFTFFWINLGVRTGLYLLLFLPLIFWFEREIHILKTLKEMLKRFKNVKGSQAA